MLKRIYRHFFPQRFHCHYVFIDDETEGDEDNDWNWFHDSEPTGFLATVASAKEAVIEEYLDWHRETSIMNLTWVNVGGKGIHHELHDGGKHVGELSCRKLLRL